MSKKIIKSEKQLRLLIRQIINEVTVGDFSGGDSKNQGASTNDAKQDVKSVGSNSAERAENEFQRWGGRDENDPEMKDVLSAYWKNAKSSTDFGASQPWSAAFISYAVSPPESPDPAFPRSTGHVTYMKSAKNARDAGKKTGYVAYKPSELEGGPQRNDIVCTPRGGGSYDGWDNIGQKNHCDIFVGNNEMIGGNLGNTSKKKTYDSNKASMIIKKISESDIRKNIKKLLLKEVEVGDFSGGESSGTSKSSSDSGTIHVTDPVKIVGGGYPEKNVRAVESAMEKEGITNKFLKIAILSVIAKESNMKPKDEKPYSNTSNSRIRKIFGKRVPKDDASLDILKADPKAFFDKIYGGRYGNAPDEGYKYRGRGFNQITFKGTYKKMGELIGVDLVSNPDKLNDVSVAARVAVAFLLKRLKRHASNYNDVTTQDKANTMTARANAGWGKVPGVSSSVDRAISNTKERNAHFSYGSSSSKIA